MTVAANVRSLRPMRVLLVTDDDRLAYRATTAAALQGLPLACASRVDDLEAASELHDANVVALDARTALGRAARSATTFATLHPRIAVVLVGRVPPARGLAGVRFVSSWSPAERLLDELERAYLGLDT